MANKSPSPETSCGVPQNLCLAWPPTAWADVHVAAAISGGGDSMALLCALLEIKAEVGGEGKVFALHVNHHLRGSESDQDANWCQQQCDLLGVSLTILQGTAQERAKLDGDGLEAAARVERYELLTGAAEQIGARYLAIAHTQNDQVETVLFRLLRGSGLRGLAGMPSSRLLSPSVTLVRPLLDCCRNELVDYLASLSQTYRLDGSNAEKRFARNRLRHDLLPTLRKDFNQDVDGSILRLAAQAHDVQCYLEDQAKELLSRGDFLNNSASCGRREISLAVAPLSESPGVLVSEVLRIVWREAELPEQAMSYRKWQQLVQLAKTAGDHAVLNLPGGVRASVDAGRLVLHWQEN